jgi:hypothetical protein
MRSESRLLVSLVLYNRTIKVTSLIPDCLERGSKMLPQFREAAHNEQALGR